MISDSIKEIECVFYENGDNYGIHVFTELSSNWEYDNEMYYSPVLDFLNRDYRSLAGGVSTKNVQIFVDKQIVDSRVKLVINDLASLENTAIRKLIDTVLLSEGAVGELSCSQRWLAYSFFDNNDKILPYYSKTNIEHAVVEKAGNKRSSGRRKYMFEGEMEFDFYSEMNELHKTGFNFESVCRTIEKGKYQVEVATCHTFNSYCDMIRYLATEMIRLNVAVKKCNNCGKYYVPTRSDALFCTNYSPQNKTKTCQEYGKYANYLDKTRTDEATRLYRQIYNSKNNMVRRCKTQDNPSGNPILNADLENFIAAAVQFKDDVKKGILSKSDYITWLQEIKEKKG